MGMPDWTDCFISAEEGRLLRQERAAAVVGASLLVPIGPCSLPAATDQQVSHLTRRLRVVFLLISTLPVREREQQRSLPSTRI